mgnify:CR=1 FL=1
MLHLFDTAQGKVVPFEPREPGKVSMYVCGPTVYGPPHLGHGRFSLVFDVLRRYLTWTGLEVNYVSNITDIDDKIINRANDEGRDWSDIAQKCEQVWWKAMEAIGVERPTSDPHATAYVHQMVELIADLITRDVAYVSDDGVYFSPTSVADYGLLARQSIESLQAGARVEVADHKHSPIDFALWKFTKPGEPAWPSPWGEGRPGWHSECVVMSLQLLGEGFDLHCGGADLRFPHHENERAQAVALGKTFANHWMHNGFVVDTDGEKMSKSLGNVTNLLDLVEHYDPRAYRMLLLQTHYRSPVRVGQDNIDASVKAVGSIDGFFARMSEVSTNATADEATLQSFRAAMNNDLDTPGATALMFDTIRKANAALDVNDHVLAGALAGAVGEMCVAFGLQVNAFAEVSADIVEKAQQLDAARAAKDFAAADALRNELQAAGYVVETTKEGTKVRRG